MRGSLRAAIAVLGVVWPATGFADDGLLPAMDHERAVQCARDKDGKVWRIQCSERTRVCLYAANDELDSTGERAKPLERARYCDIKDEFDRTKLEAAGYKMFPGRVDAPYGWMRDERGRVFQVNFDLRKRLYFGVAYTPQKILDNPLESTRTSVDFGLFSYQHLVEGSTPTRHRLRVLEGVVHVEPFSAEITVAHYDVSRRFVDPLLRITTFAGRAQRHDLKLNLGLWTEVGGLEIHPTPVGHSSLWKHATAQVTVDLWQSKKLDSFLRLRTGMGLEGQYTDGTGYRSAVTPASALELDVVLDEAGFHNLRVELAHEAPRYFIPLENHQKFAQRLRAKLQYEGIVLAINDQPVTFKFALGGEKRDDIFGVPDQWAFVMDAGLRFSLWAPPRVR